MILVTGASGFVGRALTGLAVERGLRPRCAVRQGSAFIPGAEYLRGFDLSGECDWRPALDGVDVVVHSAARVHVMQDKARDPISEFRRVNVEGTVRLARQAATAGVRRFVFISSIKVNGEGTLPGRPFLPTDPPAPQDPYGVSKFEAEQALWRVARETGLEVVVVRPVLVYGPGVRANFAQLMRWVLRGIPLPLGAIRNKRSLVAIGNLVDFLLTCVVHPRAGGEIFLVSDGEDLSTTELIRRMARALGCPARLVPVPESALVVGAGLVGRGDMARRLIGTLQVDSSKARELLQWVPPISVDEGLRRAAADFR